MRPSPAQRAPRVAARRGEVGPLRGRGARARAAAHQHRERAAVATARDPHALAKVRDLLERGAARRRADETARDRRGQLAQTARAIVAVRASVG